MFEGMGALGIVIGLWLDINNSTVAGLVRHKIDMLLMLLNMSIPMWRKGGEMTAGIWNIALAYQLWIISLIPIDITLAELMSGRLEEIQEQDKATMKEVY